jgi:hypothetical protein
MTVIHRISHNYQKFALYILCGLTLLGLLLMRISLPQTLLWPLVISFSFHYLCSIAYSVAWQTVASRSPEVMPRLHLAASFMRLILAALVLLVYCLVVAQKTLIMQFAIVFMVYYLVILLFDAVFFAKVSKISNQ